MVSLAIVPESSLVTSVIAVVAESLVDVVTEDAVVALTLDADEAVPALLLLASPWSPTPPVSVSRKHAHAQRHQASQRRIAAMVASAAST